MPKKRALIFLVISIGLYFLANQTQVGWVYIISNGFIGLLLVSWVYTWGVLKSIQIDREIIREGGTKGADISMSLPTFYEDDVVNITLSFNNTAFKPAFLIYGQEDCLFAPPDARHLPLFIPSLFKNRPITLNYQTSCHLRGLYTLSEIPLHSSGPFGFFQSKYKVSLSQDILIYPAYHPLKRLRIFEKWAYAQQQSLQTGQGTQVIGTREYRPGDSPRWIHWRSTARTGKLVIKEFSDDEHVTLNVILDLHQDNNLGEGKFSTFETAIRIAATLGYYATQQKVPFHLLGNSEKYAPPKAAFSWWGCLNYLAKVHNDGQKPLDIFLEKLSPPAFAIILVSNLNKAIIKALLSLQQKGCYVLPILITLDTPPPPLAETLLNNIPDTKIVNVHAWAEEIGELAN